VKLPKHTTGLPFECHRRKNHIPYMWLGYSPNMMMIVAEIVVVAVIIDTMRKACTDSSLSLWREMLHCGAERVCKSFVCFCFRDRLQSTFHIPTEISAS
jgi:hypothetical protein